MTKINASQPTLNSLIHKTLGKAPQQASTSVSTTPGTGAGSGHAGNQQQYRPGSESLLDRAKQRQLQTLLRRQQNIESILQLAQEFNSDKLLNSPLDLDWYHRFTELAQDSSSRSMQVLWASILAQETATPGSFGYKSLLTLRDMSMKEAEALQKAATLIAKVKPLNSQQLLHGYYRKPSLFTLFSLQNTWELNLAQMGLSYPELLTLMNMDLLHSVAIESAELSQGQSIELQFHGQTLQLKAKHSGLVLTYYKLTQTGVELSRLVKVAFVEKNKALFEQGFIKDFQVSWRSVNHTERPDDKSV